MRRPCWSTRLRPSGQRRFLRPSYEPYPTSCHLEAPTIDRRLSANVNAGASSVQSFGGLWSCSCRGPLGAKHIETATDRVRLTNRPRSATPSYALQYRLPTSISPIDFRRSAAQSVRHLRPLVLHGAKQSRSCRVAAERRCSRALQSAFDRKCQTRGHVDDVPPVWEAVSA